MPCYGGKESLYGDYGSLDLNSQRLFERRWVKRVSGVADARRDVKLKTHDDQGSQINCLWKENLGHQENGLNEDLEEGKDEEEGVKTRTCWEAAMTDISRI